MSAKRPARGPQPGAVAGIADGALGIGAAGAEATRPPLVLASASPRRTEVLRMLGLPHEVLPANVAEEAEPGESPEAHVERLARAKAAAVAPRRPDALVLGGDTVVALDGRILGKPSDEAEALAMLVALSGREHTVHSGLALARPGGELRSAVASTRVFFRAFGEDVAARYVATGEPMDKAGAYGIQGLGAALVRGVEGDYFAVVGLPVAALVDLLEDAGWGWSFPRCAGPGG